MNARPRILLVDSNSDDRALAALVLRRELPEVEVDATAVPVSTPERRVKLGVKARAEDCLLAKLNVWMNGVPIYGRAGIDLRERKTHEHAQDLEVDLSAGRNEIQISALNEHGVESLRETVVVNCEAQAQPDLYVLAIGVAHYRDQKHNLTYSDKDARDVAAFFRDNAGTFAHVYVKTILDEPSAHLDVEQRVKVTRMIKHHAEGKEVGIMVIDHDIYLIDMISERILVFEGEPGVSGTAAGPFGMRDGMNRFLDALDVTFRRDQSGRPRINKPDSYLDREQKASKEFYYYTAEEA